ncbi:hypothetical protein HKCCE2091_04940 [Rhodobacterales bacterium HKCCE2091]|nr:hypothetical protein [Rhodobacterales bacterium HKCCE2091]
MFGRGFLAAAGIVAILGATASRPVTLHEVDAGGFSSDLSEPTEIGLGVDAVAGTGRIGDRDFLHLSTLAEGTQALTITLTAPAGAGLSRHAAGFVAYSLTAPRWALDWTRIAWFHTSDADPVDVITFTLGPDFVREVWIGFLFLSGEDMQFHMTSRIDITPDTPDSPAPVPLPGGLALIGSTLACIAVLASRRRRA